MIKKLSILAFVLSLAAPVAAQSAAAPPAATTASSDVAGTWNATFTTQQGEITALIKLTKSGAKLTGTISSQMGESALEAEQKDKSVSMWFTMAGQNGQIPIELAATIDGNKMKGTASASGSPAGEWVATRARAEGDAKPPTPTTSSTTSTPAAARSLTGTWSVSVELPNMTASPTMVLKQEGEKLTGEYVSGQYGKFPITGTVKGSDVTITFAMNVEGNALNVTYAGKVDSQGKLAGTVTYGDMMSGTFTASPQK